MEPPTKEYILDENNKRVTKALKELDGFDQLNWNIDPPAVGTPFQCNRCGSLRRSARDLKQHGKDSCYSRPVMADEDLLLSRKAQEEKLLQIKQNRPEKKEQAVQKKPKKPGSLTSSVELASAPRTDAVASHIPEPLLSSTTLHDSNSPPSNVDVLGQSSADEKKENVSEAAEAEKSSGEAKDIPSGPHSEEVDAMDVDGASARDGMEVDGASAGDGMDIDGASARHGDVDAASACNGMDARHVQSPSDNSSDDDDSSEENEAMLAAKLRIVQQQNEDESSIMPPFRFECPACNKTDLFDYTFLVHHAEECELFRNMSIKPVLSPELTKKVVTAEWWALYKKETGSDDDDEVSGEVEDGHAVSELFFPVEPVTSTSYRRQAAVNATAKIFNSQQEVPLERLSSPPVDRQRKRTAGRPRKKAVEASSSSPLLVENHLTCRGCGTVVMEADSIAHFAGCPHFKRLQAEEDALKEIRKQQRTMKKKARAESGNPSLESLVDEEDGDGDGVSLNGGDEMQIDDAPISPSIGDPLSPGGTSGALKNKKKKQRIKPSISIPKIDGDSSDERFSDDEFGEYMTTREWKKFYRELLTEAKVNANVLRHYKAASNFIYGEAMPNFVHTILNSLKLTKDDVFYDIGSGLGNVCLQVAAQTGARCIGIEIREDLDVFGQAMVKLFNDKMKALGKNHGQVELIQGDALNGDYDHMLIEPTVVFMNNVCYNGYMQATLLSKYMSTLAHNVRVVAIKDLFPRMDVGRNPERWKNHPVSLFRFPFYKAIVKRKNIVSWTSSAIPFHIYTVDRVQDKDVVPPAYLISPGSSKPIIIGHRTMAAEDEEEIEEIREEKQKRSKSAENVSNPGKASKLLRVQKAIELHEKRMLLEAQERERQAELERERQEAERRREEEEARRLEEERVKVVKQRKRKEKPAAPVIVERKSLSQMMREAELAALKLVEKKTGVKIKLASVSASMKAYYGDRDDDAESSHPPSPQAVSLAPVPSVSSGHSTDVPTTAVELTPAPTVSAPVEVASSTVVAIENGVGSELSRQASFDASINAVPMEPILTTASGSVSPQPIPSPPASIHMPAVESNSNPLLNASGGGDSPEKFFKPPSDEGVPMRKPKQKKTSKKVKTPLAVKVEDGSDLVDNALTMIAPPPVSLERQRALGVIQDEGVDILLGENWARYVDQTVCLNCSLANNESSLLMCDTCDLACHTYCHDPPFKTVPDGEWYCPLCIKILQEKNQLLPTYFEDIEKFYDRHKMALLEKSKAAAQKKHRESRDRSDSADRMDVEPSSSTSEKPGKTIESPPKKSGRPSNPSGDQSAAPRTSTASPAMPFKKRMMIQSPSPPTKPSSEMVSSSTPQPHSFESPRAAKPEGAPSPLKAQDEEKFIDVLRGAPSEDLEPAFTRTVNFFFNDPSGVAITKEVLLAHFGKFGYIHSLVPMNLSASTVWNKKAVVTFFSSSSAHKALSQKIYKISPEVEGRFEPVRASTTANVGAFVSLPSTKPLLKAPSPVEFNGKLFSTWQDVSKESFVALARGSKQTAEFLCNALVHMPEASLKQLNQLFMNQDRLQWCSSPKTVDVTCAFLARSSADFRSAYAEMFDAKLLQQLACNFYGRRVFKELIRLAERDAKVEATKEAAKETIEALVRGFAGQVVNCYFKEDSFAVPVLNDLATRNISIRKEWVEQAPLLVSRAAGANALMATFKSPMCKELAPALVDKLVEHFATCLENMAKSYLPESKPLLGKVLNALVENFSSLSSTLEDDGRLVLREYLDQAQLALQQAVLIITTLNDFLESSTMQWLMADAEGDKIVMHLFYALQRPGTLDDPSHSVDSFRLKLLEALHPHMEQLSSRKNEEAKRILAILNPEMHSYSVAPHPLPASSIYDPTDVQYDPAPALPPLLPAAYHVMTTPFPSVVVLPSVPPVTLVAPTLSPPSVPAASYSLAPRSSQQQRQQQFYVPAALREIAPAPIAAEPLERHPSPRSRSPYHSESPDRRGTKRARSASQSPSRTPKRAALAPVPGSTAPVAVPSPWTSTPSDSAPHLAMKQVDVPSPEKDQERQIIQALARESEREKLRQEKMEREKKDYERRREEESAREHWHEPESREDRMKRIQQQVHGTSRERDPDDREREREHDRYRERERSYDRDRGRSRSHERYSDADSHRFSHRDDRSYSRDDRRDSRDDHRYSRDERYSSRDDRHRSDDRDRRSHSGGVHLRDDDCPSPSGHEERQSSRVSGKVEPAVAPLEAQRLAPVAFVPSSMISSSLSVAPSSSSSSSNLSTSSVALSSTRASAPPPAADDMDDGFTLSKPVKSVAAPAISIQLTGATFQHVGKFKQKQLTPNPKR